METRFLLLWSSSTVNIADHYRRFSSCIQIDPQWRPVLIVFRRATSPVCLFRRTTLNKFKVYAIIRLTFFVKCICVIAPAAFTVRLVCTACDVTGASSSIILFKYKNVSRDNNVFCSVLYCSSLGPVRLALLVNIYSADMVLCSIRLTVYCSADIAVCSTRLTFDDIFRWHCSVQY